ncbi:uncharacterized protein LOC131684506 [Topomyia yanbarensis]|uniref:uncharacterized protein LOC131684506 n=1 Tax=Topomyia yanbarensis TaxID=2498891 RepID=UPI00273C507F|nr:uncharacterized protein LOC131684506 [Topomyia yanbarensis]
MRIVGFWILLLQCYSALSSENVHYSCKDDRRYLALNICVVENVDSDEWLDLAEIEFPNESYLEFWNGIFHYFGSEMFQLLGDAKQVTFRNGFLRELLFWSHTLEELRIINTDLVLFDVLSEPNFNLKQLAIRSPLFSSWSPGMGSLKALEVIDIAYCNFSFLNLDWFGGYQQLRVLDVSNNGLYSLHSGPFLQLEALEELYIWGNRLEYLWRFPDAFPQLKYISLSANWWLCDWVTMARDTIFVKKIISMDSDFNCEDGWIRNGGLCCRRSGQGRFKARAKTRNIPTFPRRQINVLMTNNVNESSETAIGVEMDGSIIYVDRPLQI